MKDPKDCECTRLRYCDSWHVETHGLDCGPYERWHEHWWQCMDCGAKWDESELREREDVAA